ncbi:unnamed protein product, partial [Ectocarpus sp. 8 AP-2014]
RRNHGFGHGNEAAAEGADGDQEKPHRQYRRDADGQQYPGVALRHHRYKGVAVRGRALSREAQVPPRVPDETAVRDDDDPERPVRLLQKALPEHVRLPPGVVEPHVEREHDPNGALQLHARQRRDAGQRHELNRS